MRLGTRQRVGTVTVATAASGRLGVVSGMQGAVGILLRFSGGSNSSNPISGITGVCLDAAATAIASGAPAAGVGLAGAFATSILTGTRSSNAVADGCLVDLRYVPQGTGYLENRGCPTAYVYLAAQMNTADSTGVVVDAWPIYDSDGPSVSDLSL